MIGMSVMASWLVVGGVFLIVLTIYFVVMAILGLIDACLEVWREARRGYVPPEARRHVHTWARNAVFVYLTMFPDHLPKFEAECDCGMNMTMQFTIGAHCDWPKPVGYVDHPAEIAAMVNAPVVVL